MKIDGADFVEIYHRPCLAVCRRCKNHGIIIFDDGSYSDGIHSLTEGEELLKKLIEQNTLNAENARRISDQLACSDLPLHEEDFDMEAVLKAGIIAGLVIATVCPPKKPQKSKENGSSDSNIQSFSC